MKFNAHQIAKILNGEIVGNAAVEVESLAKIEEGENTKIPFQDKKIGSKINLDSILFLPPVITPTTLFVSLIILLQK